MIKINTENFISKNDVILIALSGGADSIFLAEYFKSIKDEYSLTLKAAHIEHGIRGAGKLGGLLLCREILQKKTT